MRRIRIRKKTWAIPLAVISGAGVIGGSVSTVLLNTSVKATSNPIYDNQKQYIDIDESTLDSIQPENLKPDAVDNKVTNPNGLLVPFNSSNPMFNALKNEIDQEVIEKDILFFIQSLMNSKSKDLEMQISKPNVHFRLINGEMSLISNFTISYQNKTKFTQYYYLDNGGRPFSIRESHEVLEYWISGKVVPKLYDQGFYGYEVVGETNVTTSNGTKMDINFNQYSKALNTKFEGATNDFGYLDIYLDVKDEIKKLTSEDIAKDVFEQQRYNFELVKAMSGAAQNVLKNIAADMTVEAFLSNSADDLIDLLMLMTVDMEIPYKEEAAPIIKGILKNQSLPKIIYNNSQVILQIARSITILEPFMPTFQDILNDSEENIRKFIAEDAVSLINSLGSEFLTDFPGLLDVLPLLGSNQGILTVLTSQQAVPLLFSFLEMMPWFGVDSAFNGVISILLAPETNLMKIQILDLIVSLTKIQLIDINTRGPATLVNDSTSISNLKRKLINKDIHSLQKFFTNIGFVSNGQVSLNPNLNLIDVKIVDETANGFKIKLEIAQNQNNTHYFVNGQKAIYSTVKFGEKEELGNKAPTANLSGNMLEGLISLLMPDFADSITGLLQPFIFDNPKFNSENLHQFLSAFAFPVIDDKYGTYYDWLNSLQQSDISTIEYYPDSTIIYGQAMTKYTIKKNLQFDLWKIYEIIPDNIDFGGMQIPFKVALDNRALPWSLTFARDDYFGLGQNFATGNVSFDVKKVNGENQIFWQAPSKTVIDINLPHTTKYIFDHWSDTIGRIIWNYISDLYRRVLPNIFYSIKEIPNLYVSQKPMQTNLDLTNYNPDIFYDITVKTKADYNQKIENFQTRKQVWSQEILLPNTAYAMSDWFGGIRYRHEVFEKSIQQTVNGESLWIAEELFDITLPNKYWFINKADLVNLQYSYIKLNNPLKIEIPFQPVIRVEEMGISMFQLVLPFNVYNGNTEGIKMQNKWTIW